MVVGVAMMSWFVTQVRPSSGMDAVMALEYHISHPRVCGEHYGLALVLQEIVISWLDVA